MAELKPCAHCGGTRIYLGGCSWLVRNGRIEVCGFKAMCKDCGMETKYCDSMEDAAEAWNRRSDDDTAEWIDKEVIGTMTNVCSVCGSCSVYPDKYCGGCGRIMKNGY